MKKLKDDYVYKTPDLKIRFYNIDDFIGWQKLFSDMNPKQNQWDWEMEDISSLTKERFYKKLKRHKEERNEETIYYFCVEDNNTELIGIGLIKISKDSDEKYAEIGFQLNNKYWGKGLGKELAKGMIGICKKGIEIERIEGLVNKKNLVSIHILESISMEKTNENEKQWIFKL
jgi:RimJ/RimL family protein N-acetyltransferase